MTNESSEAKPLRIAGVTNQERIMICDQLTGESEERLEDMAVAIAGNLLKAFITRERLVLALIEYLVNTGKSKAAGRIVSALAEQSCSMRFNQTALLTSNPMNITPAAIAMVQQRLAGADMGLSSQEVFSMLGDLPDF